MKKKNQTLSQLQKIWDKKLADSGFVDIENRKTGALKTHTGSPLDEKKNGLYTVYKKNTSRTWKLSQMEYYRRAGQLLHSETFKSPRHKSIWEFHCDGLTFKAIACRMDLTERQVKYAVHTMKIRFGLSLSTKSVATTGSDHDTRKQTDSNT